MSWHKNLLRVSILLAALLSIQDSIAQDTLEIFEIEYFFDLDPGVGSATSIAVSPADTAINLLETLNASALQTGFHILGMRARNTSTNPAYNVLDTGVLELEPYLMIDPVLRSAGDWGLTETRLVFVDVTDGAAIVNVDQIEYFFDTDPGVGSATLINSFSPASLVSITENLASNGLSTGFHLLGMRARAQGGAWGTTETRLIFVDESDGATISSIDSLEYFFDADPGVGSGTIIDGFAATTGVSIVENLNAGSLSAGFHILGLRAKAEGGAWGLTETRLIFVDESDGAAISSIDSLEYFFDVDPGVGNGTIVDGFAATTSLSLVENLNTSGLSVGFHLLGLRAKAEGGSAWGLTETRLVFVDPSSAAAIVDVDQLEYFFDTDPGVGLATQITGFTAANNLSLVENLNAGSLATGFHVLGMRARNEDGSWGLTETRLVFVDQSGGISDVDALEYFITNDPGVGLASSIAVGTPSTSVSQVESLNTDTLAIGVYQVYVRARNQDGEWSITESRPLQVVDIGPPIISSVEPVPTSVDTLNVVITFDEAVNSFDQTDIVVSAGGAVAAGTFSIVNDSTYNVGIDLLTEGLVALDIADSAAFTNDDSSPSPAAATFEFIYDITAPTVTIDPLSTADLTPELTGTVDDDSSSVSITIAGTTYPASDVTSGIWTLNQGVVTPLAAGIYDVEVTATDVAGNTGSDASADEVEIISTALIALPATSITDTSFVANWGGGTDVANYEVDISDVADFSTFLPGFESLTTTATSDTVTGLDFSTSYYYRVRFVDNSSTVSENSDVVTLKTLIDTLTVADSSALVQIYDALDGPSWSPPVNWETARLRDWDGVSLDVGSRTRVNVVNIAGLGATGDMPNPFIGNAVDGLGQLTQMDLSDNSITGLMDFSSTAVDNLNVSGNSLEFDDLEPVAGIANIDYSNQASILFNEDTGGSAIEHPHLSDTLISIATGGSANSYTFTRNGTAVTQGTDFNINGDTLEILSIDFDNMGEFAASVTNSLVPGLTIQVTPQNVLAVADLSMSIVDQSDILLADPVSGYLLEAFRREQGFDTLERADNTSSSFVFTDVVLGDYLCGIDPENRDLFIPTYFGNEFEWELADTLFFRAESTIQVRMSEVPVESTEGDGVLNVVIEEDFGEDGGRIDARRRAARRKCGLKRRRSGGRDEQDEFELFAYGETDDNGEFQFGFLPEGVYRFFVEYPGIPLDENAFVEFQVGEFGITDTEFALTAFATEDGIEVSIERVLGIIFDYFKNLKVYPNPTNEAVNITFRHLKSETVSAQLMDLAGNSYWEREIHAGFDGKVRIDVSEFSEGIYLLHIFDRESRNRNVVTYRIIVKE